MPIDVVSLEARTLLAWITSFSAALRNRLAQTLILCVLLTLGLSACGALRVDTFPGPDPLVSETLKDQYIERQQEQQAEGSLAVQAQEQQAGDFVAQQPAGESTQPSESSTLAACPQGCAVPPPGCLVKGNTSFRTGERIYHIPGGQYYDATVIEPGKGEAWFCSEAEAVANGWRKSKL